MGKIISTSINKIKPSQDFLKEGTIKFILTCYFKNKKQLFPPAPVVRYNSEKNEYIAIDGHNLIAIYDLLEENIDIYVAENKKDYLTKENFPNASDDGLKSRNQDLEEKYEIVLNNYYKLQKNNINSFFDLRNKYSYLESEEIAKSFYEKFLKNIK